MQRRDLFRVAAAVGVSAALPAVASPLAINENKRRFWLEQMGLVAEPILDALARQELKATMPVEAAPGHIEDRRKVTHLEAVGRLYAGIAPWLDSYPVDIAEIKQQSHAVRSVRIGLDSIVDPASPDYIDFGAGAQNVVDAAFLALAMLRAPDTLIHGVRVTTKKRLADALRITRKFKPPVSNWLLFSACIEAALHAMGEEWKRETVDFALTQHMKWFVGDGTYGDGPHYHADYYDSFVIHPFLVAVLDALGDEDPTWKAMREVEATRALRYAHIQERMIGVDGSYPVVGRSITYRCGAFHHLADAALRGKLPEDVTPEQVRCGLAAVIHRTLVPAGTFGRDGWLQIGLSGHQPSLGETYISTGSLYLCANVFLPLGLPASDRFWAAPSAKWSAQKLWSGVDMAADHAIDT